MRARSAIALCLALACAAPAGGADSHYEAKVKPLLKERCFSCHGAVKQESGLRLDAASLIHKGGDSGPAIVASKSAESAVIQRVLAADDERMPPKDDGERLTAEEVEVLKAWIDAGAPIPPNEEILTDPRQHWTYQRPQKAPLPAAATRAAHPIDAILAVEHEQRGLIPAKPADRALLLRRVTLDLTGLPPTPGELSDFLADESADAYERVVDRLLESPRYGERWARHWMDVWRYSDWDGYKDEVRNSQRHIWRWRDWIIESLNADKGYDRMILEMLAADELAPADKDALRATGFLARNYNKFNRDMWLDLAVEHTSKAFLGVSLNCARCHDHKYDPIPQTDYYAFRAIFEPYQVRIDRLPGEANVVKAGLPRVYDDKLDTPTYLYKRGNEKDPDKEHPLAAGVPAAMGGEYRVEPVEVPALVSHPALQDFIEKEDLEKARKELDQATKTLEKLQAEPQDAPARQLAEKRLQVEKLQLESLKTRWQADRRKLIERADVSELSIVAARVERDTNLAVAEYELLKVQQALADVEKKAGPPGDRPAAEADLKAIEKAKSDVDAAEKKLATAREESKKTDSSYTPVGPVYGATSSGRRLALARWITAESNPLTARVAVNQMWMRHFGAPLVPQVVDFGLNAPRPPLITLLDWLAVELMTGGDGGRPWSMKHLHRVIVTSGAYRSSSNAADAPESNVTIDAANAFYWRSNLRRLEGEVVRDCVLAVSGSLDPQLGGPDLPFEEGEKAARRSLYFQTAYEKQMLMLKLFDAANPADCYRRSESIIPQQALALSNSALLSAESRTLSRMISPDRTNDEFVKEAFVRILNRYATSIEISACLEFLESQEAMLAKTGELTAITGGPKASNPPSADPKERARENLIHALFNHNDFVTVR